MNGLNITTKPQVDPFQFDWPANLVGARAFVNHHHQRLCLLAIWRLVVAVVVVAVPAETNNKTTIILAGQRKCSRSPASAVGGRSSGY